MARHRKLTQKFAGFPMFKLATGGDTYPLTSPFTSEFVGLDGLALDLQFAADKSLTARKGPTPVFTRASSGTFVGSNGLIQSAGNNIARFDHDPVTLACKGLLIEESRTNASLYSGAIVGGIGWSIAQATSIVNGIGPDGNNAYEIAEDTVSNVHGILSTGGLAASATSTVSGTTYTGSIFLKKVAGNINWVQVTLGAGGFGSAQYANFNLSTGAVGNFAGLATGTTPRIEAFQNGWYRCSIAVTATATVSTSAAVAAYFLNNTNGTSRAPVYVGSTANKFLAAMAQFETGTFPTSYIPTTTASVIRSADVCSITGSAFSGFYNPLEGSFATSCIFNAPTTLTQSQVVFDVNDTTSLYRLRPVRNPATGVLLYANLIAGVNDVSIIGSTVMTTGQTMKIAGCMKSNDFTVYLNNVSQGNDTTAVMQTSPTTFTIGDASIGVSPRVPINGTIASIRYYKKRLPNSKLQTLTV